MKRIIRLLILAPLLLWSTMAVADHKVSFDAVDRGDYAAAYEEWLPLVEQRRGATQFNLGVMYRKGEGVPEDGAEAVKWYRLAAAQGNAVAQNNLGLMYAKGEGVPEDYVRAFAWFNLAAAQGHKDAEENKSIIRQRMTSAQIAQAQELSTSLLRHIQDQAGGLD